MNFYFSHLEVELGERQGTNSRAHTRIVPSECPDNNIRGRSHSRPAGAATQVMLSQVIEPELNTNQLILIEC